MLNTLLDVGIIILSCIVLVYVLVYSLTLQRIKDSFHDKKVQKDSLLSLVFYLGVAAFAINELLQAISNIYSLGLDSTYQVLQLIALIIFIIALSMRLQTARERFEVYRTKSEMKGEMAKHFTGEQQKKIKEATIKFKRKWKI